MNFFPFGPFDVPRSEKGLIPTDNTSLKQQHSTRTTCTGCSGFGVTDGDIMHNNQVNVTAKPLRDLVHSSLRVPAACYLSRYASR